MLFKRICSAYVLILFFSFNSMLSASSILEYFISSIKGDSKVIDSDENYGYIQRELKTPAELPSDIKKKQHNSLEAVVSL